LKCFNFVVCSSELYSQNVHRTLVTGPGQVANHDDQMKRKKYVALSMECQFEPMAIWDSRRSRWWNS